MSRRVILVVDGESVITQTLVFIFNSLQTEFLAVGTTDAAEALTIVQGIRPDLVLLSAPMLGAPRLEVALAIRDVHGCKVLLMSGNPAVSEMLDDLHEAGHPPFDIVAKPIHPKELLARIRQLLGGYASPVASASPATA